MTNVEKVAIPLTIGAAVLGVWAALRNKQAPAPSVIVNSGGGVALPPIPPLQSQVYNPQPASDPNPGGGYGTNTGYVARGYGNPLRQAPIPGASQTMLNGTPVQVPNGGWQSPAFDGTPLVYTNALPPWKNATTRSIAESLGIKNLSPMVPQPGADCGCGCGGHGGSKISGCTSPRQSNKILDGSGDCLAPLYSRPNAAPAALGAALMYSVETSFVPPSPASVGGSSMRTQHLM